MDNLEKVKRHLAKPIPIVLKNSEGEEDTFNFKPLNVEQQAILMEISKRMESRPKIEVQGKQVPDIKKEDMKEMVELLKDIVKGSLEGIDETTLEDFVNTNFEQLSEKSIDLIPKSQNQSALDKIKKIQEERNARPNTESKE